MSAGDERPGAGRDDDDAEPSGNEIGFRDVDEESPHDEAGSQGPADEPEEPRET